MDEERVDEVGRRDDVLADHGSHSLALAVAARPGSLLDPHAVGVVASHGGGGPGRGVEGGVGEGAVDVGHGAVDGVRVACR